MRPRVFFLMLIAAILVAACSKTPSKIYLAKADSPHQVGKYLDAEKIILASKGEVGAVVFGPYVNLEPGKYSATFDVTGIAPTAGISLGVVDVSEATATKGENVLINAPINSLSSTQKIAVEFQVTSRDVKYELRVWSNGAGVIEYRGVEIQSIE
jgi:hypothetical protein